MNYWSYRKICDSMTEAADKAEFARQLRCIFIIRSCIENVNHFLSQKNVKHLYFLPLAQLQSAKILENGGIGEGEHAKL